MSFKILITLFRTLTPVSYKQITFIEIVETDYTDLIMPTLAMNEYS
jgi:hypothetical protein